MPPTTKRSTAKDGAARDIELANANATCARALGGSRKTWMNGTGWSSNPGHKNNPRGPYSDITRRPGSKHTPANPSYSNPPARKTSTRDLDASSVPKSPSFENVLPSPAPSEENRHETICIIDLDDADETLSNSRAVSVADEAANGIDPHNIGKQSAESVPDALRELTDEYGGLEEIRKRLRESDVRRESGRSSREQSSTAPSQGMTGSRNGQRIDGSSPVTSQGHEVYMPLTSQSLDTSSNREASTTPTIDKPATVPSNFSMVIQHFGQALTHRLKQIQGQPGTAEVQVPRLTLLQEAVRKSDLFYLVLHQVYCRDTLSPMIQSASPLGFRAVHAQGLTTLSQLLLDNNQMGAEAVDWFSKVPLPLELTLQSSSIYRFTFGQVLLFLSNISQQWTRMKQQSTHRKCPPSANEMAVVLGLHSPVLQDVLFRAILRELFPGTQDRCFQQCELAFHGYQSHFLKEARSSTQLMVTENQAFLDGIRQLWLQHQEHGPQHAQQTALNHSEVSQMAPPQQRQRHLHSTSTTNGPNSTYQIRPPVGGRNLHINTSNAQQGFTLWPGNITSVVPSSPSIVSSPAVAEASRMPSAFSGGQRNAVPSSFSAFPPGHNLTSPASTSATNEPLIMSASPSWPLGLQTQFTAPTTPGYWPHVRNQAQGSVHSPQFAPPSEAVANVRLNGQAVGNDRSFWMNVHAPSAQSQITPPITRLPSNSQTETPYFIPPTTFADIHKPFIRPTSLNTQTTTSFSALHQAHITSPTLSVSKAHLPAHDQKYFVYLMKVHITAERLHAGKRHFKWSWTVSSEDARSLAVDRQTPSSSIPRLSIDVGSRFCRLRCIKTNTLSTDFTESDWVAAENVWPSGIAVLLNGTALEVRRKLHHGKDQPINITSLVKEGENDLSIAVSKIPDETLYAFAIETSQVTNTRNIKDAMAKLDWAEARERILKRATNADPDIQILDTRVNVDLSDPYTSAMWYIPVRGMSCHHNECFDLDVFLSTRGGKQNEPCGPDAFRCPICGKDARPQSIVVDGFLTKVREELQRLNRLDVKSIVLDERGTWQIKEMEETGESGDGSGRRRSEAPPTSGKPTTIRKESEVIELDSDD